MASETTVSTQVGIHETVTTQATAGKPDTKKADDVQCVEAKIDVQAKRSKTGATKSRSTSAQMAKVQATKLQSTGVTETVAAVETKSPKALSRKDKTERGVSKSKTESRENLPRGKKQELGSLGEDMACHYLKDNDIEIIERNWKCIYGEADIIALEDDVLIFIEVKTRSQGFPGLPEYAVTAEKRAKYEKIAVSYLMGNQRPSGKVRFDVIAIQMTGEKQCLLRHHRDAFASGD